MSCSNCETCTACGDSDDQRRVRFSEARPASKSVRVACGEDVELDAFDNLTEEIQFAVDMARSMWCPKEVRDRLAEFIRKGLALVEKIHRENAL